MVGGLVFAGGAFFLRMAYADASYWAWFWLIAAVFICWHFYRMQAGGFWHVCAFARKDALALVALIAALAPLYLAGLSSVPFQILPEEPFLMTLERQLTQRQAGVDVFGFAETGFSLPVLGIWLYGMAGKLLGGIDLAHMRFVNGLVSLAAVGASFLLFRLSLPRRYALAAALLVGIHHVFIGVGRHALRETSTVLIEAVAVAVLLHGYTSQNRFMLLLGGMAAGAGWYLHFPARLIIGVALLFFFAAMFWRGRTVSPKRTASYAAICLLGFFLLTLPILALTIQRGPSALTYQASRSLLSKTGQQQQMRIAKTDSPTQAIFFNIASGLAGFNRSIPDGIGTYPRTGFGFFDPLSGILLLVGLWLIARMGSMGAMDVFAWVACVFYWLFYSFTVNGAPSYVPLLAILPFSSYVLIRVLQAGCERLNGYAAAVRIQGRMRHAGAAAVIAALSLIAAWNLAAFYGLVVHGRTVGDDFGAVARYVSARSNRAGYAYYLVADEETPFRQRTKPVFRSFDTTGNTVLTMARFFLGPGQSAQRVSKATQPIPAPEDFFRRAPNPPFSLLMSASVWQDWQEAMRKTYPSLQIHALLPDGSLVAVEVMDS